MNYFERHGNANYDLFRDCLSSFILQRYTANNDKQRQGKLKGLKKRSPSVKETTVIDVQDSNTEGMSEFLDFLATEIFSTFPEDLQSLSYSAIQAELSLTEKYVDAESSAVSNLLDLLPPSVIESIEVYTLVPSSLDIPNALASVIREYINSVSTGPPQWSGTRTTACEICQRDWINLSYHHLIPKQVHAKVLKRKWHEEWILNSVAWLCRACHSFVHRIASNEELAREWYTVELLLNREDVQDWAKWVSRVRWKAR